MKKCVKCHADTKKRITIDLDIEGIPVCDKCYEDVRSDFATAIITNNMEWFTKKYIENEEN